MNPVLISGAIFVLVVALIVGPYYVLILKSEVEAQQTLRQRIKTGGSGLVAKAQAGVLKEANRLSSIGPLDALLSSGGSVSKWLKDQVQRSGVDVSPGRLVLGSGCLGLMGFVVVNRYLGIFWVALAMIPIGASLPLLVLRQFAKSRLRKFEEQFPEAVDLIARALRAGHAFPTGLRLAADELPEPVATEFRLMHDQQNYGLPLPEALKDFAQRVPLIDARFFVTAVLTQREAGGNLAEVLDNLSNVIRERFRIKRQLRVLTAHGRMTGMVLAALPPGIAAVLFVRVPEHFKLLLNDPLGQKMIIVAIGLQILGALLIRMLTNVEY